MSLPARPTATPHNQTGVAPGTSIALSTLFTYSFAAGDTVLGFDFEETTNDGGYITDNTGTRLTPGVLYGSAGTGIPISQLSQYHFVAGPGGTSDTVAFNVEDQFNQISTAVNATVSVQIPTPPTASPHNQTGVAPGTSIALSTLFTYSSAAGDTVLGFDFKETTNNGGYITDNTGTRLTPGVLYGSAGTGIPISQLSQYHFVAGPGGTSDTVAFNVEDQFNQISTAVSATVSAQTPTPAPPTASPHNQTGVAPGASIALSTLFTYSFAAGDTVLGFDFEETTNNGGYITDNTGTRLTPGVLYGSAGTGIPISQLSQYHFVAGPGGTSDTVAFNVEDQFNQISTAVSATVSAQTPTPAPPTASPHNQTGVAPGASIALSTLFTYSFAAGDTVLGFDFEETTNNGGYITDNTGTRLTPGVLYGSAGTGIPISQLSQYHFVAGPGGTSDTVAFNVEDQFNQISTAVSATVSAQTPTPAPPTASPHNQTGVAPGTSIALSTLFTYSFAAGDTVLGFDFEETTNDGGYITDNTGTRLTPGVLYGSAGTGIPISQLSQYHFVAGPGGTSDTVAFNVEDQFNQISTAVNATVSVQIPTPPTASPHNQTGVAPGTSIALSTLFTYSFAAGDAVLGFDFKETTNDGGYITDNTGTRLTPGVLYGSAGTGIPISELSQYHFVAGPGGTSDTVAFNLEDQFNQISTAVNATVTVQAAGAPTWSISASPSPANENAGSTVLTITRSSGSGQQTVYVSTVNGTEGYSVNNGDYATNVNNLPVTFGPTDTTKTVTLGINDLNLTSGSKTFGLLLQSAATSSLTADVLASGTFTIDDNDAPASATSYSVSASPNPVNDNAGTVTFTITRSGNLPAETLYASTVNNTEGYSANNGDYATTVNNLPVNFGAGVTTKTVTLPITNQTLPEPDATFGFIVQRSTGDPIYTYLATTNWTIHDVVSGPVVSYSVTANPDPVVENTGPITFTITRTGSNLLAQTLYASTVDGAENSNYSTNPGEYNNIQFQPVVFAAGASTAKVTLQLTNDLAPEPSENFGFVLTSDTNLTDAVAQTNFTIQGVNRPPSDVTTQTGIDFRFVSLPEPLAPTDIAKNYDFVGQYLGSDTSNGYLSSTEATQYAAPSAGLKIFSIYEHFDMDNELYFTDEQPFSGKSIESAEANPEERGESDGKAAYAAALAAGQRTGAIYFAVDIPGSKADLPGIEEYFQGVQLGFDAASNDDPSLQIGVYGAGITLAAIKDTDHLAKYSWLAEATGWTDSSPSSTLAGDSTYTDWNIKQKIDAINPNLFPSSTPSELASISYIATDVTNGSYFGEWTPGDDTISLSSDQQQPIAGHGPSSTLTLNGDSTSASNFTLEAQGSDGAVFNNVTGKETLEFNQFGKLLFSGVPTLSIGSLNGTNVTNDTIYYQGPNGGDYFDGSATSTSIVATGGDGNDTLIGGFGNDVLTGGAGNDTINGGSGRNTAVYSGNQSDYAISYSAATQSFTVVDQRTGSPDGTDAVTNVQQLQFADGTATYDTQGNLVAQTIDNASGSSWVDTYDPENTSNSLWSTSSYDANGNLLSQTTTNDDGTHSLTMYDVNNSYNWSSATINFDAQWNETSVSGTNDDGSHTTTPKGLASAYDTALWFATPFDPNWNSTAPVTLTGDAANDFLVGNAGNDMLVAGTGNDILYGNGGSNTFAFGPGSGQDKIMDFQTDQDVIQFNPALFANYAAVMQDTTQVGANTVIQHDANTSITLANTLASSLAASNFHFS